MSKRTFKEIRALLSESSDKKYSYEEAVAFFNGRPTWEKGQSSSVKIGYIPKSKYSSPMWIDLDIGEVVDAKEKKPPRGVIIYSLEEFRENNSKNLNDSFLEEGLSDKDGMRFYIEANDRKGTSFVIVYETKDGKYDIRINALMDLGLAMKSKKTYKTEEEATSVMNKLIKKNSVIPLEKLEPLFVVKKF